MITRFLEKDIFARFYKGKIISLMGARQVGKTTLLEKIEAQADIESLFLNCDEPDVRTLLKDVNSAQLRALIGRAKLVIIDEAQRVQNIGLSLKLLVDNFKDVQVVVSGSSAFELSNSINEPLTGRLFEFKLFPMSFLEMQEHHGLLEEKRLLEQRLIYGSYPEIITSTEDKRELLSQLGSSYLYKDIFAFQDIRRADSIEKLLKALALQVGSEVSFNELSRLIGLDASTIRRYIDLLEKSYIVFHLNSFSRNIRNELKKSTKIYFFDNGIRNSIIGNFNPLDSRTDKGALWENYLVSQRFIKNSYDRSFAQAYFWRTSQQQEVDYLEEKDSIIDTWEFKYNPKKTTRLPLTFSKNYDVKSFLHIHSENYYEFLT